MYKKVNAFNVDLEKPYYLELRFGADMAQPASASTMETAIARLNSLVLMERMNWFSPL